MGIPRHLQPTAAAAHRLSAKQQSSKTRSRSGSASGSIHEHETAAAGAPLSSSVAEAVISAVHQSEAELAKCVAQVHELSFERDCHAAEANAAKSLLKRAHEELATATTNTKAASLSSSSAAAAAAALVFYGSNKSARAAAVAAAEKAAAEKATAAAASATMATSARDSLAEVRCEVATQEVKTLQGLLKSSRDALAPLKAERAALMAQVEEWKRKSEEQQEESQQAFQRAQSSGGGVGHRDMGAITKVIELEGLVEQLRAQLAQAQAQLAYSAANPNTTSTASSNDTISTLRQQVASLREECARKGRLLTAAKQRAEGAEATAAQATSSLEACEEKQKRMSSELARRRSTIEDLTKRLSEAEATCKREHELGGGSCANGTHGGSSSSELQQGSKMREDAAAALSRDARQRQQVSQCTRAMCQLPDDIYYMHGF